MPKKSLSDIGECTRSYEKWLASRIPLIQEDLRLKHAEMKKALFPFMRATFYRWAQVWPQVCGDLVNNDCNDPFWPAASPGDVDADQDNVAVCAGDCDDARATVYPGAPENCDGFNNDCNDPGWPIPHPGDTDNDHDAWALCAGDCDDARATVYPGAPEICDGRSNDCTAPRTPVAPTKRPPRRWAGRALDLDCWRPLKWIDGRRVFGCVST